LTILFLNKNSYIRTFVRFVFYSLNDSFFSFNLAKEGPHKSQEFCLFSQKYYLIHMAEDLIIAQGSKEEKYTQLIPQIKALLEGESDVIANMGNTCAALKEQFGWLWVGFYMVKNDELVLGPFQGPVACTRIQKGRGVCGAAWQQAQTLIVPDVELFPGHIACSSLSRSEIVIPVINEGIVIGVLDVDSVELNSYDAIDQKYLEHLLTLLEFNV
jgi:L-methionine (R)-S-oxide reductase